MIMNHVYLASEVCVGTLCRVIMVIFTLTTILILYLIVISGHPIENSSVFIYSPRSHLNFTELAAYDGCKSEQHTVVTEHGYILTLFRIPPNEGCEPKIPILFMHGVYLGSDDCIVPGPKTALGYILSDACYDVWCGNSRGNRYSRRHTNLDPNTDKEYWQFSFEEIGVHDLPATIDYILQTTNMVKLNFVGHARGSATLMVLASKKPEYNDKINLAVGISTTANVTHAKLPVLLIEEAFSSILRLSLEFISQQELFPYEGHLQKLASTLCSLKHVGYPVCSFAVFALLGYNKYQITEPVLPVVVGHAPTGISLQEFIHWGQVKKNRNFVSFDHGRNKNEEFYGQSTPPKYDLGKVNLPWALFASENDWVASLADVISLNNSLPNVVDFYVVPDKTFGHLDFVYGKDIPEYIAPRILNLFGSYRL